MYTHIFCKVKHHNQQRMTAKKYCTLIDLISSGSVSNSGCVFSNRKICVEVPITKETTTIAQTIRKRIQCMRGRDILQRWKQKEVNRTSRLQQ